MYSAEYFSIKQMIGYLSTRKLLNLAATLLRIIAAFIYSRVENNKWTLRVETGFVDQDFIGRDFFAYTVVPVIKKEGSVTFQTIFVIPSVRESEKNSNSNNN